MISLSTTSLSFSMTAVVRPQAEASATPKPTGDSGKASAESGASPLRDAEKLAKDGLKLLDKLDRALDDLRGEGRRNGADNGRKVGYDRFGRFADSLEKATGDTGAPSAETPPAAPPATPPAATQPAPATPPAPPAEESDPFAAFKEQIDALQEQFAAFASFLKSFGGDGAKLASASFEKTSLSIGPDGINFTQFEFSIGQATTAPAPAPTSAPAPDAGAPSAEAAAPPPAPVETQPAPAPAPNPADAAAGLPASPENPFSAFESFLKQLAGGTGGGSLTTASLTATQLSFGDGGISYQQAQFSFGRMQTEQGAMNVLSLNVTKAYMAYGTAPKPPSSTATQTV